jgi:hypothetical protein
MLTPVVSSSVTVTAPVMAASAALLAPTVTISKPRSKQISQAVNRAATI